MFQSHHLLALDGVPTSTFTTGMTWTFFPEAHPALTCPVKKTTPTFHESDWLVNDRILISWVMKESLWLDRISSPIKTPLNNRVPEEQATKRKSRNSKRLENLRSFKVLSRAFLFFFATIKRCPLCQWWIFSVQSGETYWQSRDHKFMPRNSPGAFFFWNDQTLYWSVFLLQEKNLLNTCELQTFAALTFPCLYLDLLNLRWLEKNDKLIFSQMMVVKNGDLPLVQSVKKNHPLAKHIRVGPTLPYMLMNLRLAHRSVGWPSIGKRGPCEFRRWDAHRDTLQSRVACLCTG